MPRVALLVVGIPLLLMLRPMLVMSQARVLKDPRRDIIVEAAIDSASPRPTAVLILKTDDLGVVASSTDGSSLPTLEVTGSGPAQAPAPSSSPSSRTCNELLPCVVEEIFEVVLFGILRAMRGEEGGVSGSPPITLEKPVVGLEMDGDLCSKSACWMTRLNGVKRPRSLVMSGEEDERSLPGKNGGGDDVLGESGGSGLEGSCAFEGVVGEKAAEPSRREMIYGAKPGKLPPRCRAW